METDHVTPTAGPGRPGLSFETYAQAYHQLTSDDGNPPSQRQLRKFLGTGSNTTLAGFRRRISEERVMDEKPLDPSSVDAELLAAVQRLARQIAIDEAQVADDRVDELQKEADNRVSIAETTMEKRLKDTDLLEYRATQAERDLAEVRGESANNKVALLALKEEHLALQKENAAGFQHLAEANRQVATLTRQLTQQEDALKLAQDAEKTAIKETSSATKEHQTAISLVQQCLTESQTALATMTEKHASLNDRFDERNRVIEIQKTQHQELQARMEQSVASRSEALVQLDDLRRERETLINQCSELSAALGSEKLLAKVTTESLKAAVNDKATQIEHLQKTVAELSASERKR